MSEMKETKEILKSSNPKNPNVDNMKQGWEIKKLGEFCEFINGLWTGKKPPFQTVGVIRNTNFSKDCQLDYSDIVYLEVEQSQFQKRKLQYGDIILEKSGGGPKQPVGRVVIFNKVEGDFSFSNFTSVIRIKNKDDVDFNFLHRYLFFEYISGATEKMQSHSTGIRNLKFDDYKDIEIPLPPLPEQQRIVSILDKCFAAIAKAKANAEQNLKNAKELFESYLQGVFEKKGEGWEKRKVKEIGNVQTGTTPKTAEKENYGNFIPFIKPADVDFSGIGDIRYDNEGLSEIGLKKGRKMESGSILMVCIGATIGKVGFAEREVSCNQQINSLTVKKEFEPKFIYYAMTSKEFQEKVLLEGKGAQATLPIINKSKWENLTISFPKSKTEQQTIVRQLDALLAETQKLEAVYQKKIDDLEELKKSILQKAFAGELKMSEPLINAD
jgi:type I restriction enzyme S subunit